MTSASEILARFAAGLEFGSIPEPVVERVLLHLLDTLGVALAGSTMEFGRRGVDAARALGGDGTATVIGGARRLPPVWAAFANGVLAHGLDFDDTHQGSVVHVSAGIVPAAVAAAEGTGASRERFLVALVVGIETSVRIGLAGRGAFHARGFHPTGLCNTFGAAAAAARLHDLDEHLGAAALGIAGSQAAGLLEFLTDGSDVKRIHAGWAAHAGLTAARLAAAGFSGPREVLEGRLGFYRGHLGDADWDVDAVTADLGRRWHAAEVGLKPYPCCHYNHAFADAALRLRREHGVGADEVERAVCLIAAEEAPVVCEPLAAKRAPSTEYGAKFSLPYTVASILVRGRLDVDDFTAVALADGAVMDVARRVEHEVDPEAGYPQRFGGALRLHLRDGRVLEAREPVNRGSAERPLTAAEVEEKFRRNAGRALSDAGVERVLRAVRGESIEELAAALAGAAPPRARKRGMR